MTALSSELPGYTLLPEAELVFFDNKLDRHPLRGLIWHGPYSLKFGAPSSLRFALMAPQGDLPRLNALVQELQGTAMTREATNYYPDYPGFQKVFRIPIAPVAANLVLPFPDVLAEFAELRAKYDLARELFNAIAKTRTAARQFRRRARLPA